MKKKAQLLKVSRMQGKQFHLTITTHSPSPCPQPRVSSNELSASPVVVNPSWTEVEFSTICLVNSGRILFNLFALIFSNVFHLFSSISLLTSFQKVVEFSMKYRAQNLDSKQYWKQLPI